MTLILKKAFIGFYSIAILMICSSSAFSQDTVNNVLASQFLIKQSVKLTPEQILSTFKKADESWLPVEGFDEPTLFENAVTLNVFDYFDLNGTYDSPLKKETFKQTSHYKMLLDSLKKIKHEYLNSVYYEFDFNSVFGDNFSTHGNGSINYSVNYDLQKKGFQIKVGEVSPVDCNRRSCPNVFNDVEFSQLPTIKINNSQGFGEYFQYLFIPMDATSALEIESNREDTKILRVFNLKGIYTATFSGKYCFGEPPKAKLVKGGNLRILMYNKKTGKIYFDKLYPQIVK